MAELAEGAAALAGSRRLLGKGLSLWRRGEASFRETGFAGEGRARQVWLFSKLRKRGCEGFRQELKLAEIFVLLHRVFADGERDFSQMCSMTHPFFETSDCGRSKD